MPSSAAPRLVEIPWWDGDLPGRRCPRLRSTPATEAVFIVSPNNPTGGVASEADLRKSAAGSRHSWCWTPPTSEFADADPPRALLEMRNVVVTRTLSKAYGLAGLRVGYLLGSPDLVAAICALRQPLPGLGPFRRLG